MICHAPDCCLYHANCMDILPTIESQSIDCIIADLPYGTTYCKWDSVLSLDDLWKEYKRIIKKNCPIILTASQPFTSMLVMSNLKWFRCEWVWDKVCSSNFANAKKQPLKQHESILVFGENRTKYYPIKTKGKPNHKQGNSASKVSEIMLINTRSPDDLSGMKYPKSILQFPKHSSQSRFHPTQKPVELMSYLINTYSLPGETILDNTMGSGSTGVACVREKRKFIGIEINEEYYTIACGRISEESRINQYED